MPKISPRVTIYVLSLLLSFSSDAGIGAFLFPGIRHALRTGRTVNLPRYKIGVLDEPSCWSSNGTGYLVDLMQTISRVYREQHDSTDHIPYDIVPVKVWQQLADRAHHEHWEVAFGLISPMLLHSDVTWRNLFVSPPLVATSVKIIASTKNTEDFDQPRLRKPNQFAQHHRKHRHPTHKNKINLNAKEYNSPKYTLVVTRNSDEERLLVRAARHRGKLHLVDSLQEGLAYIERNADSVVVTDSLVADYVAEKPESEFTSLCPARRIHGSANLYYGFFGKDKLFIDMLSDVIERMSSDTTLSELNERFFGHVVHC